MFLCVCFYLFGYSLEWGCWFELDGFDVIYGLMLYLVYLAFVFGWMIYLISYGWFGLFSYSVFVFVICVAWFDCVLDLVFVCWFVCGLLILPAGLLSLNCLFVVCWIDWLFVIVCAIDCLLLAFALDCCNSVAFFFRLF